MSRKEQRSKKELTDVTNRLFYEWQMLVSCTASLEALLITPNQFFKNVFIESGAIHARNLVKFFFPYGIRRNGEKITPKDSDVIANDFFQKQVDIQENLYSQADILKYGELGGHADLQIAHIVYPDTNKEMFVAHGHYEWEFTLITNELKPIIEKFIQDIPSDFLGDRWKDKLDQQQSYQWKNLRNIVKEKLSNPD